MPTERLLRIALFHTRFTNLSCDRIAFFIASKEMLFRFFTFDTERGDGRRAMNCHSQGGDLPSGLASRAPLRSPAPWGL